MDQEIIPLRQSILEKIIAKQDASFRWGFNQKQARQHPEYLYYAPNYKSTLWTAITLADLKAPVDLPQIQASIQLLTEHFYDPEQGIFKLPDGCRFPIPCLNGNMLYLQAYFGRLSAETLDRTIGFFTAYQRFDDGHFKTPKTYPYGSNVYCYGKHTCYWGVTKLLKGISFIPQAQRTPEAQRLLENCIDFALQHEVCFSSHQGGKFIHPDIARLTFPNFYKSDFLEVLWLLTREGVQDRRMSPALELLRSKMKAGGVWELEKPMNIITPIGAKDSANAFITERATETLEAAGA